MKGNNEIVEWTKESIEKEVETLLKKEDLEMSNIDDSIEELDEEYPDDLWDFAFRVAIRIGNKEYVKEHIDDIDLNDGEESSYIYETDDEEMQQYLVDHGAFRSWEDYTDCKFAMETVNGEILAFDEDFQKEVFGKYKKEFDLTNKSIAEILDGDADDDTGRDVEEDMDLLGVSIENGRAKYQDKCGDDGYDLKDLLEELGWDCSFEGDSWKFETLGVYFVD